MRDQMIKALLAHAQGDIEKHKANVEIYLTNPVGIGEHSNVMEAIEEELNMIAKYQDQIDVIQKYFKR
jgi:selenophosphate synthase